MRLGLALLVIAVTGVAGVTEPRVAHAQDATNNTRLYRVKQGDSLELIAAEFYGDRMKAVFIMVENKLTHARPLKPGERLRIPVNREITTSPGDIIPRSP